jgi:hypothetical protein
MTEKEQILERMNQLIASVGQIKEDQFRSLLCALVKKGGKEAETLMIQYITQQDVPTETRINILLTAGDIQNPSFLNPLKKVLDTEANMHLKKAAILGISRFNNQKALSILAAALQNVGNPYIKSTLTEQIDHIKKSNPILALMPRFLKGDKDKKAFMVVLDLLKKNMTPADALTFTTFLQSEDSSIQRGAFELVCSTGDRTMQGNIFDFFFEKGFKLDFQNKTETELFYMLSVNIKEYFLRFPSLIFTQLGKLKMLFPRINDPGTQRLFLSLFCHCRAPEALGFIKDVYEKSEADIKEFIIEESAGNEQAVEFLFEKYRAGQTLKEKVVRALLKNVKGFQYFTEHFASFDSKCQELIVQSLPDSLEPHVIEFIKTLFKSDLQHLKKFLLSKMRSNFLFTFKDILFDPERQKELFALEEDYTSTITQLFPVLAVKHLMAKAVDELDFNRLRDYFKRITGIIDYEIIITFHDQEVLSKLGTKIINTNSNELNNIFLALLEKIKTLDTGTYKGFYDSFIRYTDQRGAVMSEEEIHATKRVRENFKNIIEDIKKIENLEKEVRRAFSKDIPDMAHLRKSIDTFHIGAAFKIKWLARFIAEHFKSTDEKYVSIWREFFKDLPILTQLVREATVATDDNAPSASGESFHDKLRIVIRFQDNVFIAIFKDQFHEIIPQFKIVTDDQPLEPTDILVCDGFYLKEYMAAKTLNARRIFVFLENRADFAIYKAVNPRAFFPPLSMYRVLKFILQEIYLLKNF